MPDPATLPNSERAMGARPSRPVGGRLRAVLALAAATFLGCAPSATAADPTSGTLHFRSGFEGVSMVNGNTDIVGTDSAVAAPNNWTTHLEAAPIGSFNIQYQGGDSSQRLAALVPDPLDPTNTVMRFWMKEPNLGNRGRIQWNFYGNEQHNLKEFYYRYRFMIGKDMALLLKSGKMEWQFIGEFWNEADWIGSPYPFRIHPQIYYKNGGLHIGVGADIGGSPGQWFDHWDYLDTTTPLPIGEWMTIEYYIREGNKQTGKFQMAVTVRAKRTLIHDITNDTYHPRNPNPDGFTLLNPVKLYVSQYNVDTIRNAGGVLQMYYDDFAFWLNAQMPAFEPTTPNVSP